MVILTTCPSEHTFEGETTQNSGKSRITCVEFEASTLLKVSSEPVPFFVYMYVEPEGTNYSLGTLTQM